MREILSTPNKDKHSQDRKNDFVNLLLININYICIQI